MSTVRRMQEGDIDMLASAFLHLNKSREQFETFWSEHCSGIRVTFVAETEGAVVGYTNLIWRRDYQPFLDAGIPEISNMHVLDEWQGQGIGTALIRAAEDEAIANGIAVIGIGYGLSPDYARAQRLYAKLGYVPDGRGPHPSKWGDTLFLTKRVI